MSTWQSGTYAVDFSSYEHLYAHGFWRPPQTRRWGLGSHRPRSQIEVPREGFELSSPMSHTRAKCLSRQSLT